MIDRLFHWIYQSKLVGTFNYILIVLIFCFVIMEILGIIDVLVWGEQKGVK
jgi:hypothetical protein